MITTLDQIRQAVLGLPEEQRALLVDELIAMMKPETAAPLDDAWLAEVERRTKKFDAGGVAAFSWEEVKERARQRCRPHA
jgi:putative addiction module component (TIGR02574 family)